MTTNIERADILAAALDFALNVADEPIEWLRDWIEGEPEALNELIAYMEDTP